ncbi:MAG: GNAT family N-acetyltransferase [Actinomycetes bacterium]
MIALPEYDARLPRAGAVHVRRARADDWAAVRDLHRALSPQSIYFRFFTGGVDLGRELRRLLRPLDDKHETVLALIDNDVVGVASYERVEAHSAEVAFLVDARHRGAGLATLLLDVLADAARANGISNFVAETLPGNAAMLSVFRDCGLRCITTYADGVMYVQAPLEECGDGGAWPALVADVLKPPLHSRQ